ncbi:MAG TPA: hypothetical protein VKX17_12175 [Planctomycetota bacterium]|nr:hypothetical protein [Planctomycetota bacterium]
MPGKYPALYRMLFPLAPVMAVIALTLIDVGGPVSGAPDEKSASRHCAMPPLAPCCQAVIPSRQAYAPKYSVKFINVGSGGVDYDAGGMIVVVYCSFADQCAEQPIVGMAELGLVTRLQTDAEVIEGAPGFGVISDIHEFKDARFSVQARVPLETKAVNMLNGAVTVLRARERSTLAWREPFSAQIGSKRSVNGFDLTLTKCEIANDTLLAEWNCKAPVDAAGDEKLWQTRQLKATLVCSDKSVLNPEVGKESPAAIRRVFHLSHKFPTTLELNFISDLKMENLPFTLTGISIDGSAPKKRAEGVLGENF